MLPDEERKQMEALIDKHAADLAEHWDAVQIFVSKVADDGNTIYLSRGRGNWYARSGQIRDFLIYHDAQEVAKAQTEYHEEDSEGES